MRLFIYLFIFFAQIVWAGGSAPIREERYPERSTFPVIQGATDAESTQVSVILPRDQEYQVELKAHKSQTIINPVFREWKSNPESKWRVLQLGYQKLKLTEKYDLRILNTQKEVLDQRELSLLSLNKNTFRIAVASCLSDAFENEQAAMWAQVRADQPEMIFLIGDNVYGDMLGSEKINDMTPALLWMRYVQTFVRLDLYHQKKLIPIFATWDDHDYGKNDGDRNFKYRDEAQEIFRAFFPQRGKISGHLVSGPGVSSLLKTPQLNFFFMDDRSFRADAITHYGVDQEKWLYQNMGQNSKNTWIINGDQFFGAYHAFESYEGKNPIAFKNFLKQLKGTSSKVFFLSGDRHLAELMEIPKETLGYKTFELTTSAIHAKVFPGRWDSEPNPRQLWGVAGVQNYALVDVEAFRSKMNLKIKIYTHGSKVLFEGTKTIE